MPSPTRKSSHQPCTSPANRDQVSLSGRSGFRSNAHRVPLKKSPTYKRSHKILFSPNGNHRSTILSKRLKPSKLPKRKNSLLKRGEVIKAKSSCKRKSILNKSPFIKKFWEQSLPVKKLHRRSSSSPQNNFRSSLPSKLPSVKKRPRQAKPSLPSPTKLLRHPSLPAIIERPLKSRVPSVVKRQIVLAKRRPKKHKPKPPASPSQGGGNTRHLKRRSCPSDKGPRKRSKTNASPFQLVRKAVDGEKVVQKRGTRFSIVKPERAQYHSFAPARLLTRSPSCTHALPPTLNPRRRKRNARSQQPISSQTNVTNTHQLTPPPPRLGTKGLLTLVHPGPFLLPPALVRQSVKDGGGVHHNLRYPCRGIDVGIAAARQEPDPSKKYQALLSAERDVLLSQHPVLSLEPDPGVLQVAIARGISGRSAEVAPKAHPVRKKPRRPLKQSVRDLISKFHPMTQFFERPGSFYEIATRVKQEKNKRMQEDLDKVRNDPLMKMLRTKQPRKPVVTSSPLEFRQPARTCPPPVRLVITENGSTKVKDLIPSHEEGDTRLRITDRWYVGGESNGSWQSQVNEVKLGGLGALEKFMNVMTRFCTQRETWSLVSEKKEKQVKKRVISLPREARSETLRHPPVPPRVALESEGAPGQSSPVPTENYLQRTSERS